MSRFRCGFNADDLSRFYRDWVKYYGSGTDPEGRYLGETICRCYLAPGNTFPELSAEKDPYEAYVKCYAELKSHGFQTLPRC